MRIFIVGDPNYKDREMIWETLDQIPFDIDLKVAILNERHGAIAHVEKACHDLGIPVRTFSNHLYDGFAGQFDKTIAVALSTFSPDLIISFSTSLESSELARRVRKLTNKPIVWR